MSADADRIKTFQEMDAARFAGFEAHAAGVALLDNPHPHFGPDSHQADAWDLGWNFAAGRALTARVPLLEAVVDAARNYRVPHRSGYGREDSGKMLDDALAALDAQETK